MTNLTKQEIQDARKIVTTMRVIAQEALQIEHANALLKAEQALDIAEKQVWFPISEAKDGFDGLIVFKDGRVEKGHISKPELIFCGEYIYEIDEATHYMPPPTPPTGE